MKSKELTFALALILLIPAFLSGQEIRTISFNEWKKNVEIAGDTLLIFNFWATWCKPCIEELPSFEKANIEFQRNNVKIILVNLDFKSKVENTVIPFLKKHEIQSHVWRFTDADPNTWISQVNNEWSGAIPATAVFRQGKSVFFKEGKISEEELFTLIVDNIQ